ncbi:hypothetical protein L210DRAFT_3764577 [Boletus edulis BED1]|uniref:Uncharacterized protein n=1 Tax=Boletus edulis BED1 TaxID=1328754 RepID=A0AAD4BHV9_BOLED|nr:hypothetical protein L210DRAFT_3764577 [Boletus edulis BED1]
MSPLGMSPIVVDDVGVVVAPPRRHPHRVIAVWVTRAKTPKPPRQIIKIKNYTPAQTSLASHTRTSLILAVARPPTSLAVVRETTVTLVTRPPHLANPSPSHALPTPSSLSAIAVTFVSRTTASRSPSPTRPHPCCPMPSPHLTRLHPRILSPSPCGRRRASSLALVFAIVCPHHLALALALVRCRSPSPPCSPSSHAHAHVARTSPPWLSQARRCPSSQPHPSIRTTTSLPSPFTLTRCRSPRPPHLAFPSCVPALSLAVACPPNHTPFPPRLPSSPYAITVVVACPAHMDTPSLPNHRLKWIG